MYYIYLFPHLIIISVNICTVIILLYILKGYLLIIKITLFCLVFLCICLPLTCAYFSIGHWRPNSFTAKSVNE